MNEETGLGITWSELFAILGVLSVLTFFGCWALAAWVVHEPGPLLGYVFGMPANWLAWSLLAAILPR